MPNIFLENNIFTPRNRYSTVLTASKVRLAYLNKKEEPLCGYAE
jgi:hypothetical protein